VYAVVVDVVVLFSAVAACPHVDGALAVTTAGATFLDGCLGQSSRSLLAQAIVLGSYSRLEHTAGIALTQKKNEVPHDEE
jgi:hypothetical protein